MTKDNQHLRTSASEFSLQYFSVFDMPTTYASKGVTESAQPRARPQLCFHHLRKRRCY